MITETSIEKEQFETFYQGNSGHAVILLPGLCGSEMEMGAIPRLVKQYDHTLIILVFLDILLILVFLNTVAGLIALMN